VGKKGIGDWQLSKTETANQIILKILVDGKWHRYQELLEMTGLSSATLSKHLKDLEEGIVEKEIRLESGSYPYPVVYRLRERSAKILSRVNDTISEEIGFQNYEIKPFLDDKIDKKECSKKATDVLCFAVNKAYENYLTDNNWKALQQTIGSAMAFSYAKFQTIFEKQ
jgi:DNA-binding HxlR family transcriptional regulator